MLELNGKITGSDPGFPTGEGGPKEGVLTYHSNQIFPTLHENEEKWTGGVSKILLCRSATELAKFYDIINV